MSSESKRAGRRNPAKSMLSMIGRAIATMVMVGIITGCIVASVMTVYILQYIGAEDEIDLASFKLGYTSVIYGIDKNGEEYPLQMLYNIEGNRTWVDFDQMTEHTKNALVAVEDQRFYEHNGVDYKRSAGAFVNLFVPIYSTKQGGSTIHQQLIKNITKDDDFRIDRKVRELFRAVNLGQRYTHDQVLEAYLNVVPFGNNTNGIEAAAQTYFGKSASELTLAESAAIVGITQKPTAHDPFVNPDKNKARQEYILEKMLEQEYITQQEYKDAVNEKLVFKKTEYFESVYKPQNYFVDHVIEDVIVGLMETKDWTRQYAAERLYQDGYKIYATVDKDIQEHLENYYSTWDNFPQQVLNVTYYGKEPPQSACTIIDPNGKLLGIVGGIGEKNKSRSFNRATMAKRHPGSSIKPIGVYSLAVEYNMITWSTKLEDTPTKIKENGVEREYPTNYYGSYLGPVTIEEAVRRSVNTIPVKLVQRLSPDTVFNHLYNNLGMTSMIDPIDRDLSPLALGGMNKGVTPLEMAGAYQVFVNGGYYTKPYSYYKVEDSNGKVILEPDTTPKRVLSEGTAVVMNKLLQRVTSPIDGATGWRAALSNMPTGGKTGTSTGDVDQWFIGFTPYYICQVWLGYDEKDPDNFDGEIKYGTYPPPLIFKDVMDPIHEGLEYKSFIESDEVVSMQYCTISGNLPGPGCTSTASGWYKKSNLPKTCAGHVVEGETEADKDPPSNKPASSKPSASKPANPEQDTDR